jgi:predicted phage terminase large subunit-like protein
VVAATDWRGALLERIRPPERKWATPAKMAQALEPWNGRRESEGGFGTRTSPALETISEHLAQLADGTLPVGRGNRLMVFMPPQEGKSTLISNWFPAWLLAENPSRRIAIMSASADLAVGFGKRVREIVQTYGDELGVHLKPDSRRMDDWQTVEGGGLRCVGRDTILTGKPVDILIVDDPFKDQRDARSAATRASVWSWYESVAKARMPRAIVLVNTRWHEDDLAGKLKANQPKRWTILSIPAIAERSDDPLGRVPGEEMISVRDEVNDFNAESKRLRATGEEPGALDYYHDLKDSTTPYVFSAVWQQSPAPTEGGLFPRAKWRFWLPKTQPHGPVLETDGNPWPLADCMRFITIDLAASTKTSADFTVIAAWAITPDGNLVLLDRWRDRVGESDHWNKARPLIERWQIPKVYVESRMFGTTFVYAAGRAGVPLEELEADADKWTRALAASQLQHQRRIWLPGNADWLDEFIGELAQFDTGAHDDQVDVTAYAARIVEAHWLREPAPETYAQTEYTALVDPIDRLFGAELGSAGVDLMTAGF